MGNCFGKSKEEAQPKPDMKSNAPAVVEKKENRLLEGIASVGKLEDKFEVDMSRELGSGAFAVVHSAKNKATGEIVAAKYISKKDTKKEELRLLTREIENMRKFDHPNVLKLFEVFEDDEYVIMVMELISGGELFYKIVDKGSYNEGDAADIIKQLLEGVQYLHKSGVAHRDLKPENLLCGGTDDNLTIKIADFGLSKVFNEGENLKTSCGTPDYAAPEVIKMEGDYGKEVDLWAVGVITYVLLCGYPPFGADSQPELFEQIMNGEFTFSDPEWTDVSSSAKDFIRRLLVVDPKDRMTVDEALNHEWIKNQVRGSTIKTSRLGQYNEKRKNENR